MWKNVEINIKHHTYGEKWLDIYILGKNKSYCFTLFKSKNKELYKLIKQIAKEEGII